MIEITLEQLADFAETQENIDLTDNKSCLLARYGQEILGEKGAGGCTYSVYIRDENKFTIDIATCETFPLAKLGELSPKKDNFYPCGKVLAKNLRKLSKDLEIS